MGSRRTTPTCPVAAAVVSEPMVAPMKTPWSQSRAWNTSGATRARRPPKMIADSGTPWGSSQRGDMVGHCRAAAVKRELGWAALPVRSQGRPCQSSRRAGGVLSFPSHHGTPSGVTATFVKIVSCEMVAIAAGFVSGPVPGMAADVYLMSYPSRRFRGTVQGIGWAVLSQDARTEGVLPDVKPSLNWARLAQRIPVRIELEPPDPERPYRMGMTAVVTVRSGRDGTP